MSKTMCVVVGCLEQDIKMSADCISLESGEAPYLVPWFANFV